MKWVTDEDIASLAQYSLKTLSHLSKLSQFFHLLLSPWVQTIEINAFSF